MYSAYVTTLKEPRKHSNADRLLCFEVFGNNVITNLDYYAGQKVVYFPVDGQLSVEFAIKNNLLRMKDADGNNIGGYLDPNKRNIIALKLRGEKSEGVILPIECLSDFGDVSSLNDGDTITVFNGHEICKKYIPRSDKTPKTNLDGGKNNKHKETDKVDYPYFDEHIDTSQLAFNRHQFKPGDTCYITLKMHGTSARTANALKLTQRKRNIIQKILRMDNPVIKTWSGISGTRRCVLDKYGGGYYGSNEFRRPYHDIIVPKLQKGMEVFYEIVGYVDDRTTIMGTCSNSKVKDKEFSKMYGAETVFSYGCNPGENDCYVYRMTMTNEDGFVVEIPWEETQILAEKMGLKCVPTFDKFIFTTWEDLMERVEQYYDGVDPISKTHVREGVVVRIDNREKFTAFKHKNFSFKVLEGIIKDNSDAPDMEEAEDLINAAE